MKHSLDSINDICTSLLSNSGVYEFIVDLVFLFACVTQIILHRDRFTLVASEHRLRKYSGALLIRAFQHRIQRILQIIAIPCYMILVQM